MIVEPITADMSDGLIIALAMTAGLYSDPVYKKVLDRSDVRMTDLDKVIVIQEMANRGYRNAARIDTFARAVA